MTTLNISLPNELKDFIDEQIAKGGYGTVSEYMRDLLRDAQKRIAHEKLEAMLLEGLQSGESTPMTKEDWDEIRREAMTRLTSPELSAR